MRRNATFLFVSTFALVCSGCGLFGKKKQESQYPVPAAESYTYVPPVYQEPPLETNMFVSEPEFQPTYQPSPIDAIPTIKEDRSLMASASPGRLHVVAKRDTLYSLARRYYNDQSRWKDIYQANKNAINDPNRIFVGQKLVIP